MDSWIRSFSCRTRIEPLKEEKKKQKNIVENENHIIP